MPTRYASLYFIIGCDQTDNELIGLEVIHLFVEALDRYFGNVCLILHGTLTPSGL
jgi:AP-1 complex subunit sigma 1/2